MCLDITNAVVWLTISYVYKGLLQLVAIFMAFHTHRVKIASLNDSKEIATIIYINSITLVLQLIVVEFATMMCMVHCLVWHRLVCWWGLHSSSHLHVFISNVNILAQRLYYTLTTPC